MWYCLCKTVITYLCLELIIEALGYKSRQPPVEWHFQIWKQSIGSRCLAEVHLNQSMLNDRHVYITKFELKQCIIINGVYDARGFIKISDMDIGWKWEYGKWIILIVVNVWKSDICWWNKNIGASSCNICTGRTHKLEICSCQQRNRNGALERKKRYFYLTCF